MRSHSSPAHGSETDAEIYVALETFRARKSGNEEVPGLGRRRTERSALALARKELPSLPLAPGRSLMVRLNSNRRIGAASIMILKLERDGARRSEDDNLSPGSELADRNHRHPMAALSTERSIAAHRIATPRRYV